MPSNNENVQYIIELKDLVSSKLDSMNQRLDASASKMASVQKSTDTSSFSLQNLGTIAGGVFAVSKITEYASEIINVGAKYESLGIQMKNLTGSASEGRSMFAKIREDALTSPFGVEELATANTMLKSTGLSADQARLDILALSNAVAFSGKGNDELIRMSANMQQIKNIGKASALDIKQFGYAGINIYGALAKATGKSTEEVKGMEISYELLSKSLRIAQEEGGVFYGGLSSMADSTSVKLSNMGDISKELFNDLFLAMKPVIDYGISGFTSFIGVLRTSVGWIQENSNVFKVFAISIGLGAIAFKLFNIQSAIGTVNLLLFNVQGFISTAMTGGLTLAMKVFGVTAGWAWGVATLGISTLVAGLVYAYNSFEGFRKAVHGTLSVLKQSFDIVANGLMAIFYAHTGQLDKAKESILKAYELGKGLGESYSRGAMDGITPVNIEKSFGKNSEVGLFGSMLGAKQRDTLEGRMAFFNKGKTTNNNKLNIEENKKLAKTYENKITNITIGKLVEGLSVHVQDTKEIAPKIKELISRYLIEAVNDVNIAQ